MQAAQVLIAAIVSRLKDADAKALLTAAGTYRRGKFCPMKPIDDLRRAIHHLVENNKVPQRWNLRGRVMQLARLGECTTA